MPLVGLCFCMCRCCENCGGEMHQRQRKNADCQKAFFTTMLIATSVLITAGVLCAYAANQNLTNQLKGTRKLVNSNFKDLKSFANETPAQIDYLTAQYSVAKNKVLYDLDNIGQLLGGKIHAQLGKDVLPALDTALSMASAMRETKEALENVSAALDILQDGTSKLQANLSNERSSLVHTLNDPACSNGAVSHTCNTIRGTLSQLGVNANFAGLPEVSQQLENMNGVLKTDLSNIVQKGYSSFNDTPAMVKEQTRNVVAGVKALLDGTGGNITAFTKMFTIQDSLSNFTMFLTEKQMMMEAFYPQIDQFDFYRWIGCVAVCCMVVLILAFNFLGLLCGSCGYDKHASPTTRGCLSNTGGILLMAGVGFSFIFSWVLMGVVTASFVVGGNVEKLVMDTPYMVNPGARNILPAMLFGKPDIDLTIESVYRNCKENKGLYSVLKLDNIFNVNMFLNKSVVNKGVTLVDLLSFANELEAQADQLPRGALENALKGHASSIRQIHSQQVVPMEQAMSTLSQSVRQLQRTAATLPNAVTNVLSAIDSAEYLISQNASFVVQQNTFWFGLGCCAILLIPSIIFSVKLAKFYRRMDTEDVYDEVNRRTRKGGQRDDP
ncbi:hypothetical protein JZ751_022371 [Albula glossodonta]|uniref:Prominin 1 b n=1 Tax=Albula glossodonta TaxID=121402 RepID=A0A8T2NJJ3_9TELE|nr:hypothetical protein JZ751_022371 [Albula glossodonta]